MAPRNVDQGTADSVVRESLGLTADDLGMNPAEDSFGADDNDNDFGDDGELQNDNVDTNNDRGDDLSGDQDDLFLHPEPKQPVQQQQQSKQPAAQDRLPPTAEVRVDGKGNLVDRKTGQVVARAGAEARMYQKLHRTTAAYTGLQAQHNDTVERLNKAVEIGTKLHDDLQALRKQQGETSPERFGLNASEAIEAMNFAKEAKTDPVGTIKKLLTRAASSGIDLTSIGLSGGNFDPKAFMDLIRGEINTAMNPLKERSQRETAQEQQTREATERAEAAKTELNKFLNDNPGAREYLPVFHQVYSQPQFQHMTLGEVWARLQLNLMRRQSPPSNQRPANRNQNRRPPSGRPAAPRSREPEMASVDTSYDDIVRGILPK